MDANASGVSSEREGVPSLGRLLEHPAIWRGRSVAQMETVPTGFAGLDAALPGQGWPRTGVIEILVPRYGVGEVHLLLPLLATLTRKPEARWCAWISPPWEPFAPELVAQGLALDRLFIARAEEPLWAFEQSLITGGCDVVLGWVKSPHARDVRRLQLAAEKGRALGVLFRPRGEGRMSSSAVLRMIVEPAEQGVQVTLLKSRGGHRGAIYIRAAQQ